MRENSLSKHKNKLYSVESQNGSAEGVIRARSSPGRRENMTNPGRKRAGHWKARGERDHSPCDGNSSTEREATAGTRALVDDDNRVGGGQHD